MLDNDTKALVRLVGRRVIPILVKDDGQPMLESMDMVKYIDNQRQPILVGVERPEITDWAEQATAKTGPLPMPRYPLLGLPEFATVAARDHYILHKGKSYGDFIELRANTRGYIAALMPELNKLDALIVSSDAINGTLSLDDVRVLPLLRSAAMVEGLRFPPRVRDYFQSMMGGIDFRPLPVI